MNYLRSNLLADLSEPGGSFDYFSAGADAVVFDIRNQDEATSTKFHDHLIKWIDERSENIRIPEIHLRVTVASAEQLRILFEEFLHPVISCVWVTRISNAQQVRDLDVEIRRIEMRSGWIPGQIKLIPEFDSGHPIQILEEILESVDRIVGICVDLGRIYQDITFRETSIRFDSMLISGITARLAIAVSYFNLRLIVVDSFTDDGLFLDEFAAQNGFSGVLTAKSSQIAEINRSFSPSAAQLELAGSLISEWGKYDGKELGLWSSIESLVRARYLLEQSED